MTLEIERDDVVWRFDDDFLRSNWTCLFGRGCQGILDRPAEELHQGCCSLGAHFGDGEAGRDEAMRISALAAVLTPEQWQYRDVGIEPHRPVDPVSGEVVDAEVVDAEVGGIFGDVARTHTRVVDGACVFLNRPGFGRGPGCALHVAALDAGESPIDWKPSVCWQLPLHVDWALVDESDPDGPETATVRRWSRADWGAHGRTMAWVCTEEPDAYVGEAPVVESLRAELEAIAGPDVAVELRRRLDTPT